MRRWFPLAVCLLLVFAGCNSGPELRETPERPGTFTDETIVDYATESERVAIRNRIVDGGDVEGDLNVSCSGRPMYRAGDRAVVAVGCWPEPYVRGDAHVETGPQYSLHVFEDGTATVLRPFDGERVVHNESARGSLWIANTATNDRNITIRMLSRNGSNATVLDRRGVPDTSSLGLVGVRDSHADRLRIEVGDRARRLEASKNRFGSRPTVLVAPDGTLRATTLEYPLSGEQ